jgi:hypothetical protein
MFVCLFWCDHVGGFPTPLLVSLESFNWGGLDISCFIICKLSENTFFMIGSMKTLKLIPVWSEYYSDGWPQGRFNIPWHRGSLVKMKFQRNSYPERNSSNRESLEKRRWLWRKINLHRKIIIGSFHTMWNLFIIGWIRVDARYLN